MLVGESALTQFEACLYSAFTLPLLCLYSAFTLPLLCLYSAFSLPLLCCCLCFVVFRVDVDRALWAPPPRLSQFLDQRGALWGQHCSALQPAFRLPRGPTAPSSATPSKMAAGVKRPGTPISPSSRGRRLRQGLGRGAQGLGRGFAFSCWLPFCGYIGGVAQRNDTDLWFKAWRTTSGPRGANCTTSVTPRFATGCSKRHRFCFNKVCRTWTWPGSGSPEGRLVQWK